MWEFFKRILYLAAVNILVMVTASVVLWILQNFFGINFWAWINHLISIGLVIGFGWAMINLLISRRTAKRIYDIQLFDWTIWDRKLAVVYGTVAQIAAKHDIKMPEVGYYDSPEPNAFATWPSKSSALVAVSQWLLDTMTEEEIRWVIGHEMAHIINGDMVTMTLIQWVMNTFVFVLSRVLWSFFLKRDDEDNWPSWWYYLLVPVLDTIFGLLAWVVVMYVSRVREFSADAWSVKELWKNPMLAALHKLQQVEWNYQLQRDEMSTLKFFDNSGWANLLRSHPRLEDRIRAIESSNLW